MGKLRAEQREKLEFEEEQKEEIFNGENQQQIAMKRELEILRKEKDRNDEYLKNAATTKVHELVKLQNLLDHMTADNRVLQHQVMCYRAKMEQIYKMKRQHQETVVEKIWNKFNWNY